MRTTSNVYFTNTDRIIKDIAYNFCNDDPHIYNVIGFEDGADYEFAIVECKGKKYAHHQKSGLTFDSVEDAVELIEKCKINLDA